MKDNKAGAEQGNSTAQSASCGERSLQLRAGGSADGDFRLVKLPFRLGSNLVEFGVKATQFGVEFEEAEAMRRDETLCWHTGEILLTTRFQVNAGGRLRCP